MNILILGAGSTAISVAEIILSNRSFKIKGFVGVEIENIKFNNKPVYRDLPYLGDKSFLQSIPKSKIPGFVSAIGNRYYRELSYYYGLKSKFIPINVISTNSTIEYSAEINDGVIIFPNTYISFNVSIGENCLIESGVVVESNTVIGNNCNIEAGSIISGNSIIKKNVIVGKNSVIAPNIIIGKNQTIDPNTFIKNSLPDIERKEVFE